MQSGTESQPAPKKRRGPGKPFQPGNCANPGGRKKSDIAAERLGREIANTHGCDIDPQYNLPRRVVALNTLYSLGIAGDVSALKEYINHTIGKAPDESNVRLSGNSHVTVAFPPIINA